MVAYSNSNLTRWIPPVGGLVAGVAVAIAAFAISTPLLEDIVWNSGLAAVLPVAQPPLGNTARALLALGGGLLAASIGWAALYLIFGPDGAFDTMQRARAARPKKAKPQRSAMARLSSSVTHVTLDDSAPTLRRADAHPDAPARRPLSAKDLGEPMPLVKKEGDTVPAASVKVEPVAEPVDRDIPVDLDVPLAAFDPAALPAAPREPVRPVPPLRSPALAEGERIDSVELPRMPTEDTPSIETLLRRLEQGTRRPRRATIR